MPAPRALDFTTPAARRRYLLDRVRRRGSRGAGSELHALVGLPGKLHDAHGLDVIASIFAGIPVCLIGAHAVAAYAPERMTQDVDCFTPSKHYRAAAAALRVAGYREDGQLAFATSALGLFGARWTGASRLPLDLISTERSWGDDAFAEPARYTNGGDRVMPLAFLVLMELDAARSGDLFDLSRMLGRSSVSDVDAIATVVARYDGHDPAAIDDLREIAEIGRWEYDAPPLDDAARSHAERPNPSQT